VFNILINLPQNCRTLHQNKHNVHINFYENLPVGSITNIRRKESCGQNIISHQIFVDTYNNEFYPNQIKNVEN
jgi:hypothetical protein